MENSLSNPNLSGAEKVLRNAELNFYLSNGFTQVESERFADEKIIKTRKLLRSRNIIRY